MITDNNDFELYFLLTAENETLMNQIRFLKKSQSLKGICQQLAARIRDNMTECERIQSIISQLPSADQQVIELCFLKKKPDKQVASIIKCSVRQVYREKLKAVQHYSIIAARR